MYYVSFCFSDLDS